MSNLNQGMYDMSPAMETNLHLHNLLYKESTYLQIHPRPGSSGLNRTTFSLTHTIYTNNVFLHLPTFYPVYHNSSQPSHNNVEEISWACLQVKLEAKTNLPTVCRMEKGLPRYHHHDRFLA